MFQNKGFKASRYLGLKQYELTDHLDNVNVSVLDKLSGTGDGNPGEYAYLSANLSSFTDYYPFGMQMPERNGSYAKYRHGYNAHEKDDEVAGKGNHISFGDYGYSPRIARRWNVDPLDQISISNYAAFRNSPIIFMDINGREPVYAINSLNPWFKLKPTQWYMYTDGIYHSESFNAAAIYSTANLRADAYQNVYQRNSYYGWVQKQVEAKGINSKWFGAAELVTGFRGVGGTSIPDWGIFTSSATDKFLQGGNEFLFSHNMKNAQSLLKNGSLSGGFIDANGTQQSFCGLSGICLDSKMVEFEQSKVQEYINSYTGDDLNDIMSNVNNMMNGSLPSSEVRDVIKKQFNNKFDFGKYEHRVKLGQELIKKAHEKNDKK